MDRNIDEIYSSDRVKLGEDALQVMQHTIRFNGGVGVMSGYYDAELTILSVSDLLLHNLGYSYEALMKKTKGSLKNFFMEKTSAFWRRSVSAGSRARARARDRCSRQMGRLFLCVSIRRMRSIRREIRSGSCLCR